MVVWYHPWLLSWLDRGALTNVNALDVVRRWFEARRGTSRKVFIHTVVPKGFSQPLPNQRGKTVREHS